MKEIRRDMMDTLAMQQQHEVEERQQRIRSLVIKAKRCVSEISWRFFPDGGVRQIDLEPAEQMMGELFQALKELQELERRDKGES